MDCAIDGLPAVEPTRSRVDEMLQYTDENPDHIVAEIPPRFGQATIEKIAINAVIAGCKPEFFPVILAATEGMSREEFNLLACLPTTHPGWPAVMVNGPITEELEINYGTNTMGQGFRSNMTIGRAITLICMNIGGAIPGQSDDATHGRPHKKGLCFAENEQDSPWEPFHVERGFNPETSTVTIFSLEGLHNLNDHYSKEPKSIMTTYVDGMASIATTISYFPDCSEPHLSIPPEVAQEFDNEGWSKMDIKKFIYNQARIPWHKYKEHGNWNEFDVKAKSDVPWFDVDDPHAQVGICSSYKDVHVTVTGGFGQQAVFLPTFIETKAQTVPITRKNGEPIKSVEELN